MTTNSYTINFNEFGRGTVIDTELQNKGLTVSAFRNGGDPNKPGEAMIFDTANPTGGDYDLKTNNLGKVLIISEDNLSSDPDDNAGGGTLRFDFDGEATVKQLTFLDVEESAWVRFYDDQGNHIKTVDVHGVSNNGQKTVDFNVDGVARMDVVLGGSGAIDNLVYDLTTNDLDGIVEGTAGDDRIDVNYTGDPDGDRVDANDQILPGEGQDDDIIRAGDGNDIILSGNGDDDIFGGKGNEEIWAGSGNDIIRGEDGNDWMHGQDGNDRLEGGRGDDMLFGEAGNDILLGGDGHDTLDGGEGNDEMWGGAGNDVLTGGNGDDWMHGQSGNDQLDGGAGNDMLFGEDGDDAIFAGAGDDMVEGGVGNDRIEGDDGNDTIDGGDGDDVIVGYDAVSIKTGDTTVQDDDGSADTIDGGKGNDTILGGKGDDTLTGGEGHDTISGGDDADTIIGGNGGDVVDGGAGGNDFDTLDLRDVGPFRLTNLRADSNGNGQDGTVELLNNDGSVKESFNFTEIENILGAPVRPDIDAPEVDEDCLVAEYLFNDNNQGQQPVGDRTFEDTATELDGVAQTGTVGQGSPNTLNDSDVLDLDGHDDAVVIAADDAFQIGKGALSIEFNQDQHVGSSNDTLISRDSSNFDDGGHLTIGVTQNGAVTVRHQTDGDSFYYNTPNNFFSPGEDVRVFYEWDDQGVDGRFVVQNLSRGTEYSEDINDPLTIDMGDNFNEPWTIGASQIVSGDNTANNLREFFDGQIDNVKIYDLGPKNQPDGIVSGTDGNDLIDVAYEGDPDGDMVDANDEILPGEGPNDDIILAGKGDDTVLAGEGDDDVFGGKGNDDISGEDGNDTLLGEDGDDTIDGGEGADTIDGGRGKDDITGGDGDDVIAGGTGNDTIAGNGGNDVIDAGAGNDDVDAGEGDDVVDGGAGKDDIVGGDGHDMLAGGADDDCIEGNDGNDVIYGDNPTPGSVAAFAADSVHLELSNVDNASETGTPGDAQAGDSVVYNNVATVDGQPVSARLVLEAKSTDGLLVDLSFSETNEILLNGDNDANDNGESATFRLEFFDPTDGSPVILDPAIVFSDLDNNTGIEIVSVGGGQLETFGVPTNSSLDVTFDGTTLIAQGTEDNANSNNGEEDTQIATVFSGTSSITFEATSRGVNSGFNFAPYEANNFVFDEGEGGDDKLLGGAGDDVIFGQAGNDTITGGEGADEISGGDDADTIIGGTGGDVVDGGAGGDDNDTLDLRDVGPFRLVDLEPDSNGNGQNGTVELLNPDGTVRETFTFTEIENILGEEFDGTPVAEDDTAETDEDTPVTIAVLDNDSDPDGDELEVIEATSPDGEVTINDDGTITFTPDENFNGDTTITYTVTDPGGNQDTATVNVTVNPVNDDPVAQDDTVEVDEDGEVTIPVLDNDSDVDGDDLEVIEATSPDGEVTINDDGTITFEPNPDFNGDTTITYTVSDGNGGQDTATVNVTVNPVNDDPIANDDTAEVDEDGEVTIPVLDNDTDTDGDDLEVISATSPDGDVTINDDGTITFEPNPNFNGDTTITYTVSDGNGGEDTATVNVTVNPVNDDPVANDDAESTDFETPVDITVLDNDTDVDGDDLEVTDATVDPAEGTVEINDDGTLTFTPADGFEGPATITYTVEDGNGGSDTATVTVTVGEDPRDGIVEGTAAGEVIDVNYDGDPDGDFVDNDDALLPGEFGDDDIIRAEGGNDTVFAGEGNDEVFAGDGDDTVFGEAGDDIIEGQGGNDILDGGEGNDTITGGGDDDTIIGGEGNDILDGKSGNDDISGGEGDDTIIGGGGDDLLDGGAGDDEITGGNNNDEIIGGDGNDTVYAGSGNDVINTGPKGAPDLGYPGLFPGDDDPDNDKDFVDAGNGDDIISTGDDDDIIIAGKGDDIIDGGFDRDEIDGGAGNDRIVGGEGSDTILGGDGNDVIYAGIDPDLGLPDNLDITDEDTGGFSPDLVTDNGQDFVDGGDGNDTIFGADDDDELLGGAGKDFIDGGLDDDIIDGGDGDDVIIGGQGADMLSGGDDKDVFKAAELTPGGDPIDPDLVQGSFIGDMVDGGAGGNDFDTLDLTGTVTPGGRLSVDITGPDSNGNGFDGTVTYFDDNDNVLGTMKFSEIENIIPCFTPGTMIATPQGERRVEELREGDRVITRDNGIQEIRWVGQRSLEVEEVAENPDLSPILIKAGALGRGLPERDLIVSPQHRVLIANDKTQLFFEENEVLVAAKHLVGLEGVRRVGTVATTYVHFMFDAHEVVLSNGAWTESFQPGDYTLGAMGDAARKEIFAIFPELETEEGLADYTSARKALKRHEASLLIHG
ncbi:tandem-95 repeat protein [Shimia ponticola]|uniref:tandem-95 repeat protein n=1 Tax=Shimia ponticola TaxID=2582893 RepID=UPI00164A3A87|nr:tandem-95 repeat protein [Shimia ponticola]